MDETDEMTVLQDGDYSIRWSGGRTFSVYLFEQEVNVFSAGYDAPAPTSEQAREKARQWWDDGGKADTQQVVRESEW